MNTMIEVQRLKRTMTKETKKSKRVTVQEVSGQGKRLVLVNQSYTLFFLLRTLPTMQQGHT